MRMHTIVVYETHELRAGKFATGPVKKVGATETAPGQVSERV
jgi:hypothetical protein